MSRPIYRLVRAGVRRLVRVQADAVIGLPAGMQVVSLTDDTVIHRVVVT